MSQESDVIAFIKDNGSITTKQAMEELGCFRLSGRIYDMRKHNIPVEKEMITVPTRNGKNARVARYTIPGGVPDCFRA